MKLKQLVLMSCLGVASALAGCTGGDDDDSGGSSSSSSSSSSGQPGSSSGTVNSSGATSSGGTSGTTSSGGTSGTTSSGGTSGAVSSGGTSGAVSSGGTSGTTSSGGTSGTATSSSSSSSSGGTPWDPCTQGTVIDLNTAGTRAGSTVTYAGNTDAIPPGEGISPQCLSYSDVIHVQALKYTLQNRARLVISTFHAGTVADFDTVVWARTQCAADAPYLGCDDDVSSAQRQRSPAPPDTARYTSMFTTATPGASADAGAADVTTPAGTTVFIFVGGYSSTSTTRINHGAFELSVTEVTPPSAAAGPCDPDADLCESTTACAASGTDYSSFACVARGALNAPCRTAAPFCDNGLACNLDDFCVAVVEVGQACDPDGVENRCVAGASCYRADTDAGVATCVADGAHGGFCRDAAPLCDNGLACNSYGMCVTALPEGSACESYASDPVCADGTSCQDTDAGDGGVTSVCITDGVRGGGCRDVEPKCDNGLGCGYMTRCVPLAPAEGACDPLRQENVCPTDSSCQDVDTDGGTATLCVANGTLGGNCRVSGAECDRGLVCRYSTCEQGIMEGEACTTTGTTLCETGTHCLNDGADAGAGTCVRDGTAGGQCRYASPRCDGVLVCRSDGSVSRCVDAVPVAGSCDPTLAANICVSGSVCVGTVDAGATCQAHSYTHAAATASWVDACGATGSTHLLADKDDDVANYPLPFGFTYFGMPYAEGAPTTVSTNGWFSLSSVTGSKPIAELLPVGSPDNAIYALWMDLTFADPQTGATSASVCVASTGTAPNRTLVVQWDHAGYYSYNFDGNGLSMELQLHETSNSIDVLYQGMTGTNAYDKATVGLESVGGTSFVQLCGGKDGGCSASTVVNTTYVPQP